MILALTLMMQPAASQSAEPSVEEAIIVIGRKQKEWRGVWKIHKGQFTCKTAKSTRDREIDQIGCDTIEFCVAPHAAEMQAVADSNGDRTTRNTQMQPINKSIAECVTEKRKESIAALADRRAMAGVSQ